jgi:hypothetical protein
LEQWEAELQAKEVSWIAVGPIFEGWMAFEEVERTVGWLDDPAGPFQKMSDGDYRTATVFYEYAPDGFPND